MIIVVPVSVTDGEVKDEFIQMFNLFGPYDDHDLVVVSRPADFKVARKVFRSIENHNFKSAVHHIFDEDGRRGWPGGPNHYWRETALYLRDEYRNTDQPWMFLEMDMTPIDHKWADRLQEEYDACGKPFMGNLSWTTTTTAEQEILNLCQHLVGAAIYPPDLDPYSKIWTKVNQINTAWDVLLQWEFPPHAHDTELIQFCFRTCNYTKRRDENDKWIIQGEDREPWPGDGEYTFSKPLAIGTAVIVHGCNDGSLARLVYKEITGGEMVLPKKVIPPNADALSS
jgi:hypothetical protein